MNNRIKTSRRILLIIVPLVLALVFIAVCGSLMLTQVTTKTVVGNVNGMDIYAGEIKLKMNSYKADAIAHFEQEYNIKAGADFWTTQFGDTTPEQYLRNEALEEIKSYKLQLQLGQQYGLVDDASYEQLVEEISSKNIDNSQKVANGEAIYGQKTYSLSTYYEYRLSNLQLDLQKKMFEEGEPLYADDATLKQYYEQKKGIYYKKEDTASFGVMSVDVDESFASAVQVLEDCSKIIEKTGDYEAAKSEISAKYPSVSFNDIKLDEDSYSSLSKQNSALYEQATSLAVGKTSSAVQDTGTAKMLYCKTRKSAGYKPFDEVYSTVISQYSQEKYGEYVSALCEKYAVNTNNKFEKISARDALE